VVPWWGCLCRHRIPQAGFSAVKGRQGRLGWVLGAAGGLRHRRRAAKMAFSCGRRACCPEAQAAVVLPPAHAIFCPNNVDAPIYWTAECNVVHCGLRIHPKLGELRDMFLFYYRSVHGAHRHSCKISVPTLFGQTLLFLKYVLPSTSTYVMVVSGQRGNSMPCSAVKHFIY